MTNEELIQQLRTASIQADEMRLRDFGYLFKTAAAAIERLIAYNEFWEKAAITAKDIIVKELPKWIPVTERLPEENEYVMIWCGGCHVARIKKGISEEQRKAMKRGELDDLCETGWTLSSGYFALKRSQSYKDCDEQGNNRVPYCWYANGGPMKWFGQEVTHWMPLPEPPKEEHHE